MANASLDQNRVPALIGVSSSDGETLIRVKADPSAHTLNVMDASTGSDLSGDIDSRDDNRKVAILAASSADGETPVEVYVDTSGNLLVDSS